MTEVEIKDKNNNVIGKMSLPENVFGVRSKKSVIHETVVNFLANQRQGTHATKTKGLVRGGGKKPWRQKHTGKARSGSIRSPLWRGGGTIFGPQPRDYSYNIPKKVKRLALMAALNEKISSGAVVVIDSISIQKPRTKEMISILKNLGLDNTSVLIVLPEKDDAVIFSARNIPGVSVVRAGDLNAYDLLTHNLLLATKEAVKRLEEARGS
jgi:large subunit ribosomal protein L4